MIKGDKKESTDGNWEYCEVMTTEPKFDFNHYTFRFYARATNPKESYTAIVSKKPCNGRQPDSQDKDTQLTLNELKVTLISQAWEMMPDQGSKWFSLRFRRAYKQKK